ncbi:MAG: glycosyltransferase [Bacteroidales bacterium]|jgi:cellulose synthase/poly-beta-1,6-N-acetylglucosamine synthase-like glycosyltransferase|nr:glycosyltransferase [Bacteroidales bacterium]
MIDLLIDTRFLPLCLLIVFAIAWILQLFYYWGLYWRLARFKPESHPEKETGVTVVICAHNEYHHLNENLPLILEQDYPEYEVLVVDHASDDDTQFLLSGLEEQYPHLNSIRIQEDLNFFSGKKFPLSIGIKSAHYSKILLTDADCRPASSRWIKEMSSAFGPRIEVVLGYGAYNKTKGLLNKLIRFDTAHIAIQYLSYALAGFPYMGVGRNLSYLKQVFYRNKGFISHYQIRSGDDDLFINSVANRSNTSIRINPESYTFSDPKQTLEKWITQKRRHLSTSIHYKFRHKLPLGIYSLSLLFFYTLFILLISLSVSVFPVLLLVFLRLITQYVVFARCLRQLNEKDLIPYLPFFDFLLLMFNLAILVSNVFRKTRKWK